MCFTLTLWTNDPSLAAMADQAGVDRIGIDLETLAKSERQVGRATWISTHNLSDLKALRPVLSSAELFVRCNPFHRGSEAEVDDALRYGAQVLMLPNFTQLDDLRRFAEVVAGRAKIIPLVERLKSVELINEFTMLGIDEFHVGLNDLSIDLGLSNRIAVLGMPIMDRISAFARGHRLRFGIGGLARAGDTGLPVPSDLVYAQHARLGSSGALIARVFFRESVCPSSLSQEIAKMRQRLQEFRAAPQDELDRFRDDLLDRADKAV